MAVPPSGWVPRGSVPRRLPRGREVQVRGFGVTGGPAAGDDLGAGVEGDALGAVDMRVAEERGLPAAERVVGHRHGNRHVQADHPDRHPAFEPARRLTARREEGHPVAVRVGVDQLDRLVEGVDAQDYQHRSEYLVGVDVHLRVTPEMDVYTDEIFGPVLVVLRVDTLDEAIELVNTNPYGNGVALFTASGEAARRFKRRVSVGMIGLNVPIPVPMAYYSFGGWKTSLFGDTHIHGTEGVSFYTRAKIVTSRWPAGDPETTHLHFPTAR